MPDSFPDTIPSDERGGILLTALIVTLMATALLIGALNEVGVRLEGRDRLRRGMLALAGAQAGLECAARLATGPGFLQGGGTNALWMEKRPIGAALVTVQAADPSDGHLGQNGANGSSDADTVRLTATANVGSIARTLQADFLPLPHLALRYAVCSRTTIDLQQVYIEGRVRANEDVIDLAGADIFGDITTVEGEAVSSSLDDADTDVFFVPDTLGIPPVDFEWFRQAGQRITLPAFPLIANTVITAGFNPYGNPSPRGIYWIDAAGKNVYLSRVAIRACLAILNAGNVYVATALGNTTSYYHASPDPDHLPALVVDGDLFMRIEGGTTWSVDLGEGTIVITSELTGAFLCTGDLYGPQQYAENPIDVEGTLIADKIVLVGPLT
ncbi:MAG: hypothetical protein V1774_00445, partial [Candidatus Eisenbacteria bacterium]